MFLKMLLLGKKVPNLHQSTLILIYIQYMFFLACSSVLDSRPRLVSAPMECITNIENKSRNSFKLVHMGRR